jgi:hypothetical protein
MLLALRLRGSLRVSGALQREGRVRGFLAAEVWQAGVVAGTPCL